MARITITNHEESTTITVGVTGFNANAGGKTGQYAIEPKGELPIDIDSDTTLTIKVQALATVKTPAE